jgi:hypothetical protein
VPPAWPVLHRSLLVLQGTPPKPHTLGPRAHMEALAQQYCPAPLGTAPGGVVSGQCQKLPALDACPVAQVASSRMQGTFRPHALPVEFKQLANDEKHRAPAPLATADAGASAGQRNVNPPKSPAMPVLQVAVSTTHAEQLDRQVPLVHPALLTKHRLPAPSGAATVSGGTDPATAAVRRGRACRKFVRTRGLEVQVGFGDTHL